MVKTFIAAVSNSIVKSVSGLGIIITSCEDEASSPQFGKPVNVTVLSCL